MKMRDICGYMRDENAGYVRGICGMKKNHFGVVLCDVPRIPKLLPQVFFNTLHLFIYSFA